MLKAQGPHTSKTKILVICGFVSCLALFLLLSDQTKTKDMLNSTKVKLKTMFSAESDYTYLMNINFTFKILPLVCSEHEETLLILVHTAPDHDNHRKVIRDTWGRQDHDVKLLFLVGLTNESATQKKIEEESELHKDILQGSFLDTYHNLTYKHVMALKYAVYHCPKAQFVLKVDDDVFVNIPTLKIFLKYFTCQKEKPKKIFCSRIISPPVLREGKWATSLEDYPENNYPTHCGGFVILYPQDIIYTLYTTAQKTKFFWVDDVFVSGICVKESNITHIGIEQLVLPRNDINNIVDKKDTNLSKPFLVGPINLNEDQIRALWNFTTNHKTKTMLDYLNYD